MSPVARRGFFLFLAALIIILGGLAYEQWQLNDDDAAAGAPPVGGPFALIDQNGAPRSDSDFHGKLMLVYFGYTFCPDACPTTLAAITQTLDLLGPKGDAVQPIFISVDPRRDTPPQLKSYAANFHPRLLALTGTPEALAKVEHEYGVYVQIEKPEAGADPDDYLVDHSSFIYLMGRDGKYLTVFPMDMTPQKMAAAIGKYL